MLLARGMSICGKTCEMFVGGDRFWALDSSPYEIASRKWIDFFFGSISIDTLESDYPLERSPRQRLGVLKSV